VPGKKGSVKDGLMSTVRILRILLSLSVQVHQIICKLNSQAMSQDVAGHPLTATSKHELIVAPLKLDKHSGVEDPNPLFDILRSLTQQSNKPWVLLKVREYRNSSS
jgi:DNA-binding transcriptional ArsR family regulator